MKRIALRPIARACTSRIVSDLKSRCGDAIQLKTQRSIVFDMIRAQSGRKTFEGHCALCILYSVVTFIGLDALIEGKGLQALVHILFQVLDKIRNVFL